MPYPSTAGVVVLWGSWFDEATRGGMDATMTATPLLPAGSTSTGTPNLTEAASWSWIKARTWTTKPLASGLYAFPLIANDDPDLTAFGGYRIDAQGEQPFIVNITATAATITVTNELADALAQCASLSGSTLSIPVGSTVQAIHLTDAAVLSNPAPQPPSAYYTQAQTNSVIASAIAGLGVGGGSSLIPTTIYTTNSHVPASGEFARYNPSANLSISLPAAAAGQRFGIANVSTGSSTLTFTRQGSDTFSDGSTSITLAPGERAVLIGATGGFTIESRTVLGGSKVLTPTAKTAAYTASAGDMVLADASSAAFTVTLPAAVTGQVVEVKKVDSSTNVVTVAAGSGNTVGSSGAASVPLRLNDQAAVFQANGTNWILHSGYQSLASLDGRFGTILNTHLLAWVNAQAFSLLPSRVDSVGTTSGSATVTDTAITAQDRGRPISGAGIPAGSFVGTVTAGTSFLLSSSATSQVNVNATATAPGVSATLLSAARDSNGALVLAVITWPDGSGGTFTTTTASTAFPGAVDAYNVTYIPTSGSTKTVTQAAVTRDANGAVSAQPSLVVA